MSDDADMAQEKIDIGLADAIRAARQPGRVIVATGRCLWCDEIVSDEARWCSPACRDTWQASANGGRR